jgi:hypothetical protein
MKAVGGVRQTEAPTVHRYIWKKEKRRVYKIHHSLRKEAGGSAATTS